jgi:uncharacterized protein YcbK (DUF882 family)
MKLTKNFSLSEFACKDGTAVPPELGDNAKELAENLQVLRDYLDSPLHINSAYRTVSHNKKVGGAPKSQHLFCKAADVVSSKYTPDQVYAAIMHLIKEGKMKAGGVGRYNSFTHYDIDRFREWDLRS